MKPLLPLLLAAAPSSWFGAELRTHESFGQNQVPLRVSWLVKPARGNCAITLLALFNGDRIFGSGQGHWSEIDFEIYGGSADQPLYKVMQTQYITYESITDPATERGRQHAVQHAVGGPLVNIWDGAAHEFQIEWVPGSAAHATLVYRVDGEVIRQEEGGDLGRLENALKIHSGAWMGYYSGQWAWGCSDESPRPVSTGVEMKLFRVEEWSGNQWKPRVVRSFQNAGEIDASFDRSSWGFESFAGSYCPANVVWNGPGKVTLELDQRCGPGS